MRPIQPRKLPIHPLEYKKLIGTIGKAHFVLGKFEEILRSVEAPEKIFSILIKEEAVASLRSQRISFNVKNFETARLGVEKSRDVRRMENYARALAYGLRQIKKGPITLSLIRKIHALLAKGSGMRKASIGHFRKRQNWIGPLGCKIEDAFLLPPKPTSVPGLMKNLVHYAHTSEKEKLVQIAIFFAQLLIIHPFMDGNGRVGRILIPLFLFRENLLSSPLFFLSGYFHEQRIPYFKKLNAISFENAWEEWISFFLTGIIEQGEKNCKKAKKISLLYEKLQKALTNLPLKKRNKVIRFLFQHPIFEEKNLGSSLLLRKLAKEGFLKKIPTKKEKRWIFPPLFKAVQN